MSEQIVRYSYRDCPTLEDFSNSRAFLRGVMGPFGSGKSSACVIELANAAKRQRRGPNGRRQSRWGVIRNTYPELRDTTIRTVFQWMPPHQFGHYVEAKHSYQVRAFEGVDMEILFLALDKPDDIKKLLSLELTGGWINEGREVPWAIFDALSGRVGRYPAAVDGGASWSGIWADTNPPDSDSAWYRFFEDRTWLKDFQRLQREGLMPDMAPDDYARIFKQPGGLSREAENLSNLPGERLYYARLAAGKTPEWVKVYVDGQYGFVVDGKVVYPEYGDAIHCREAQPIEGVTIYRGWDFGLTPACVFAQETPGGQLLVFNEMVSDNMSVDQFSDEVLAHCARAFRGRARFEDVGDPAGEGRVETDARSSFEILQGKGIDIRAAITNEPRFRIEAVKKALRTLQGGETAFILHPRCKVLRKGFLGGYQFRRMAIPGVERYAEKPNKNTYSHPHDALQYVALEFFGAALLGAAPGDDMPWDDFGAAQDYGADTTRSTVTGY